MKEAPKLNELEALKLNNIRLDRALQKQRMATAQEMMLSAQLILGKLDEAEYALMDAAQQRAVEEADLVVAPAASAA